MNASQLDQLCSAQTVCYIVRSLCFFLGFIMINKGWQEIAFVFLLNFV